jgi:hypothetical protein
MKAIIGFLYTILFVLLLSSCSIRSISKSIGKSKSDSITNTYKDTFSTKKAEVKKTTKKDTASQQETVDSSEVIIVFADDDSSKPSGPVVIKKDITQTTIDAGGRKIKSIKTKQTKVSKDSSGINEQTNTVTNTQDSTGKKETTTTHVKKQNEFSTLNKKGKSFVVKFLIGWWLLLLIIVMLKILKSVKKLKI